MHEPVFRRPACALLEVVHAAERLLGRSSFSCVPRE